MARKLLFYTHAFGGGGAEVVFARLAAAFADAGDEAILVVDHADAPPPARARLTTRVLPPGHAASTRALAALIRAERPDASFSALGAQNLKHLAAAILAGRRQHCVLGYHGFAVAEPKAFAQASFRLGAVATRLAARTICVSDALVDDMRRRWKASGTRTLRIYNPLPDDVPTSAPAVAIPREEGLVLACGRLVAVKRFPDLVAAFARLDPTTRLVILGEGPERAGIEAAVAAHGLGDRVRLPGHVDPAAWYPPARPASSSPRRARALGSRRRKRWRTACRWSRRIAAARRKSSGTGAGAASSPSAMSRRWPTRSRRPWRRRAIPARVAPARRISRCPSSATPTQPLPTSSRDALHV